MPVLFGSLSTSTTLAGATVSAINELVDGFTVPSAIAPYDANNPEAFGLSVCPQVSSYTSATGLAAGSAQVKFGYDLTSGCSVRLNRTELINLCCAGSGACSGVVGQSYYSKYSDDSTGIPYFYSLATGYVGVNCVAVQFCCLILPSLSGFRAYLYDPYLFACNDWIIASACCS